MKEITLEQLLDEPRLAELEEQAALSFEAPRRYVCWTATHRRVVVLDIDRGEIVRARYAECASPDHAHSVIHQLLGRKPH